jgi:hypothetical protein
VILTRIINRRNPNTTAGQATPNFNNQLKAMANACITAGDQIIVVNMEPALSYPADIYDSLHPNSTGYSKMATVWYGALRGILTQCPAGESLALNP